MDVDVGLEHFQLATVEPVINLIRVHGGAAGCGYSPRYEFWAVPTADFERLLAYVRRRQRHAARQVPPIMALTQRDSLWNNTIGFLKQSVQVLAKFGVAQRRGVLLSGAPGNGKTMASRWLRAECRRLRLGWRSISAEEYEQAYRDNTLRNLFHLRRPGIIQFDDLDRHLRDREKEGATGGHTVLLTELDGLETRHGVVYLFTSNAQLNQLDPAVRRPGRIDQVIEFPRPCAQLRRRLIIETWHPEMTSAIDVQSIVETTDGLSFAELEELKKLLVLRHLDRGQWDWPAAWETFSQGRPASAARPIGFQQALSCGPPEPLLQISARSSVPL
jgi:hypothetical protein